MLIALLSVIFIDNQQCQHHSTNMLLTVLFYLQYLFEMTKIRDLNQSLVANGYRES